MALQQLNFQTLASPIIPLALRAEPRADWGNKPGLNLSPSYQRASVWTNEQRVNLIRSLMQGLPIGAVFTNERKFPQPMAVVDGKQRLETILMWVQGDLRVPVGWFEQGDYLAGHDRTGEGVCWFDLTQRGQSRCTHRWLVSEYRTQLGSEAAEAELYERINYGGTPHEPLETRT